MELIDILKSSLSGGAMLIGYPVFFYVLKSLNQFVIGMDKNPGGVSALATTFISIKEAGLHCSLLVIITAQVGFFSGWAIGLAVGSTIIFWSNIIYFVDINAAGLWTGKRN